MRLHKLNAIRRILHTAIRGITWAAAAALASMVALLVINVVGRYIFNRPFMGTVEIVQVLLVITVFFSVAHTEVRKAHIIFDEAVSRFPRAAQTIVMSAVSFISAAYFILMAWREVVLADSFIRPVMTGTDVLRIPYFPFCILIALGAILLGLEMLFNGIFLLSSRQGNEEEAK